MFILETSYIIIQTLEQMTGVEWLAIYFTYLYSDIHKNNSNCNLNDYK